MDALAHEFRHARSYAELERELSVLGSRPIQHTITREVKAKTAFSSTPSSLSGADANRLIASIGVNVGANTPEVNAEIERYTSERRKLLLRQRGSDGIKTDVAYRLDLISKRLDQLSPRVPPQGVNALEETLTYLEGFDDRIDSGLKALGIDI